MLAIFFTKEFSFNKSNVIGVSITIRKYNTFAESMHIFSLFSIAIFFGKTSPNISTIIVKTTVLTNVPLASPKNDTNNIVANAEAAILTILFPTKSVASALS